MTTCSINKVKKEKDFSSLGEFIKENEDSLANKKFFELLEKYKNGNRIDFVEEWNNWIESNKNKNLALYFTNFHFDINNKEVKEKFSILTSGDDRFKLNDKEIKEELHQIEEEIRGAIYLLLERKNCWDFSGLHFPKISFWSAKFTGNVFFDSAMFKEYIDFDSTVFNNTVDFYNTIFNNYVSFDIKFTQENSNISLSRAKFRNESYFNKAFLSKVNLSDAFVDVNNINLFPDVEIKKIKKDPNNYRLFRRYYASKLDHESERECFALELESKFPFKIQKNKNLYSNILYLLKSYFHHFFRTLYKWISNYGESIVIPILVLFFYIYPIISIWNWQNYFEVVKCNLPFTNTEGCLNGLSKFFGKSFTYIGLFLSGLAIRNKFKIK